MNTGERRGIGGRWTSRQNNTHTLPTPHSTPHSKTKKRVRTPPRRRTCNYNVHDRLRNPTGGVQFLQRKDRDLQHQVGELLVVLVGHDVHHRRHETQQRFQLLVAHRGRRQIERLTIVAAAAAHHGGGLFAATDFDQQRHGTAHDDFFNDFVPGVKRRRGHVVQSNQNAFKQSKAL